MIIVILISCKHHCCRSTSASASAAVQSIAEDGLNSPSSEETEKFDVNEVVESSVCSIFHWHATPVSGEIVLFFLSLCILMSFFCFIIIASNERVLGFGH